MNNKNYKKGDKIRFYNMHTKRNKTATIREIRDNGRIETDSGSIIYEEDIIN